MGDVAILKEFHAFATDTVLMVLDTRLDMKHDILFCSLFLLQWKIPIIVSLLS